jgi:hypothetical protein
VSVEYPWPRRGIVAGARQRQEQTASRCSHTLDHSFAHGVKAMTGARGRSGLGLYLVFSVACSWDETDDGRRVALQVEASVRGWFVLTSTIRATARRFDRALGCAQRNERSKIRHRESAVLSPTSSAHRHVGAHSRGARRRGFCLMVARGRHRDALREGRLLASTLSEAPALSFDRDIMAAYAITCRLGKVRRSMVSANGDSRQREANARQSTTLAAGMSWEHWCGLSEL